MENIASNKSVASASEEAIEIKKYSPEVISEDDSRIIFEQQQNLKKQEAIVREKTKLLIDKRERLSEQKDYLKSMLSKINTAKNKKYEFNANVAQVVNANGVEFEDAHITSMIDIINQEEDILRQKLRKIKGEAELLEEQHNLIFKELGLLEMKKEKMQKANEFLSCNNRRSKEEPLSSNRRSSLDRVQQPQQQLQSLNQSLLNIPIQLESNVRSKASTGTAKKNVRFHEDKAKLEQVFEINANNQKSDQENASNISKMNIINIEHKDQQNRQPNSYSYNNIIDPSSFIYQQYHHKSMPDLNYENPEFMRRPKARILGQPPLVLSQNIPEPFLMNPLIDFNNNLANSLQMMNRSLFSNNIVMPKMQQDLWVNDFNKLNSTLNTLNNIDEINNDLWRVKFYY
jgi:hypothetical protein